MLRSWLEGMSRETGRPGISNRVTLILRQPILQERAPTAAGGAQEPVCGVGLWIEIYDQNALPPFCQAPPRLTTVVVLALPPF